MKQKIRASELVMRRHAEAMKAMERTITERENTFQRLSRLTSKLWKLAKQVKRYEEGTPQLITIAAGGKAPASRNRHAGSSRG